MKKLLFILSGFLIQAICKRVQVTIGKDIDLHCQRRKTVDDIWKIVWKKTESRIFICNEEECADNESRHSFAVGDHFRSTLHIKNVSLNDDGEYTCTMSSVGILSSCEIHLTVNVPPTGLILVDKDDGELLQSNGSFRVAEGENKTLICKTNTSVKPAVNLEWVFPNGLLDGISEHGDTPKDKQDGRLFVPKRTLSFTPNYTFGEDIFLTCKVDNYSSFEHIKTSIYIKKELGALTTTAENPRTSSEENQGFTRTAGTHKGSDALTTSVSSTSTKETDQITPLTKNQLYIIVGGSGAVILLLLVAVVGGMIVSKKISVKRSLKEESTGDAPRSTLSESRRALPPPPSDQSSLTANHLSGRQPSPTRSFRPAPSIPPDIPMRQMVPVSDDTTGSTSDSNRWRGVTSRGASASIPVTHSQRGLDTDMEYDLLNDMEYDVLNMEYAVVDKTSSKAHGSVPHVYRETTDGLAEYALVSRPKMGKNALQPRFRKTEQDAEFEYAVVDKSHRKGRESVPHVYTQTMSGLEEYAVVNKPKDKKKRQSEVRHTTAPGDFEAEYAVVDKSKKKMTVEYAN